MLGPAGALGQIWFPLSSLRLCQCLSVLVLPPHLAHTVLHVPRCLLMFIIV